MNVAAPVIVGSRVRVRSFGESDINDAYLGWLRDPATVRFSNQRFRTHDRTSAMDYLRSFDGSANLFFGIELLEDSRLIGTMTVYRAVPHETADIGILIGDAGSKGRGYGLEAWGLVLDWLLAQPNVRKVTCGTLAANLPMIRIAERSGMQPDGVRAAQELLDGAPVDIVHYARFNPR